MTPDTEPGDATRGLARDGERYRTRGHRQDAGEIRNTPRHIHAAIGHRKVLLRSRPGGGCTVRRHGVHDHESRRCALHIAYTELKILCKPLLDLQASGGAARPKVAGTDSWKTKVADIHCSQAVLIEKRSGGDLAIDVEQGNRPARVLVERVDVSNGSRS